MRAGERVRARVELLALTAAARGRLLRSLVTVEIDGASWPGCVAEILTLLVPAV